MKHKARIEKGNRLVRYLTDLFRETVDVKAHAVKGSGNGLDKNDIRLPGLNIEVEAKNAGSFNLSQDWEQLERQKTPGNLNILAIRHPAYPEFQKVLVVMDLNDFIALVEGQGQELEVKKSLPPGEEWKVRRWLDEGKRILKLFE